MGSRFANPFDLIARRSDLDRLLRLFMLLEERLTAAFPRAARTLAESSSPSAKQVRGATRRHHLHVALESAAKDLGFECKTGWTEPASWSFPVVKLGAFSMTIGIVETKYRGAARSLRTRSKYVAKLCSRNKIVDPQTDLFEGVEAHHAVVPDGALGGLIVAQFASHQPTKPAFLGFWVPSTDLSRAYYVRSLDEIIGMLRERLSMKRRPTKRHIERKPLRKKSGDKKA